MNDKLDRLLRRDANDALDDGGFTARVMRALPAPAPSRRRWWDPALVLGGAALGSFLAVVFLPSGTAFVQGYIDLAQNRAFTPAALTAIAMAGALAICSIVIAADTD